MDRCRRDNSEERREQDRGSQQWAWGAGLAAVAAVAGGLYYLTSGRQAQAQAQAQAEAPERTREAQQRIPRPLTATPPRPTPTPSREGQGSSLLSYLSTVVDKLEGFSMKETGFGPCPGIPQSAVKEDPVLNNLNALLEDIYVRYIALKKEECELYYGVFCDIFRQLTEKMKDVEPYYKKYSGRKQIAGSHFDGLRIKKPDEYDMDIVIGLPVCFDVNHLNPDRSDIAFENKTPGYIQLKMGEQFGNLPYRDGEEWLTNRAAYEWMDERNYLLRSKFIRWFKSVVARALNEFPQATNGRRQVLSGNRCYTIHDVSNQTSPAVTFLIENQATGFKLDVDLVPAIKFPESRWPICRGYRQIPPGCSVDDWMVVPKENKSTASSHDQLRCWRLAMHDQEKRIMHNLYNMKQTVRLMKKLRDSQGMKAISSYYIKTLFLWEIAERTDPTFWRNNPAHLFRIMVNRLHQAVLDGNIPYYWNKENNLIGLVPRLVLDRYASVLERLLDVMGEPSQYKKVAKYLLSADEFAEYNRKFLNI